MAQFNPFNQLSNGKQITVQNQYNQNLHLPSVIRTLDYQFQPGMWYKTSKRNTMLTIATKDYGFNDLPHSTIPSANLYGACVFVAPYPSPTNPNIGPVPLRSRM